MKVNLHILIWVLLGTLTGCTGLSANRYLSNKHSFMLEQGDPPSYVAGYIDGCSTGRRLSGDTNFNYRKDNLRFDKDALYAKGWQEGQINCRNEALEEDERLGRGRYGSVREKNLAQSGAIKADNSSEEEQMRTMWDQLRK
jgi:hypothetical protein